MEKTKMNKKIITLFISLLAVLVLVLGACVPQTTPTVEEMEEAEPAVEEPVAPEEPVEEVVEEPVEEEAEAPAPEEEAEEAPVEEAPEEEVVKIGFLAGVQDPFYFTMQRGAAQAAADLGAELVVQIPDNWNATVQTPMLDAMVARGDLDFLFLAPVDKEAMVAPLQNAYDSGLPLLTVDTFIGDGNYSDGPVTFPLSYIGSDNVHGGLIGCEALAKAIGELRQGIHPECQTGHKHDRPARGRLQGSPGELPGYRAGWSRLQRRRSFEGAGAGGSHAAARTGTGRHIRDQRVLGAGSRAGGAEPGVERQGEGGGV